MSIRIDRRDWLKGAGAVGASIALGGTGGRLASAAPAAAGAPHAAKLGWHLGCQAYSFNRFTFYEAVAKNAALGLKVLEAYPGQRLSADKPDLRMNDTLTPQMRKEVLKRLSDSGVKLVNYGVVGLSKDEASARKVFDFAKQMGIQTIVSEPTEDAFDTIEKLCGEYEINVALHNHPKPSRYWDPAKVLEVCKGRSKRIGACADTGHWMRSELNPLDAIKKLEGRIISFHFKDLNGYGKGVHDVPWGTGKADIPAMLREIKRQQFRGVFSIEYEYNWLDSVPEIARSVAYFDKVAAKLV